jgi:hypothetical protein
LREVTEVGMDLSRAIVSDWCEILGGKRRVQRERREG